MKSRAQSNPDPVFDVTEMSAQEIGAELSRLTSTFSQARQQSDTTPVGNLARSLAPSTAMLEARAAFLPPAARNPLAPLHFAAEPVEIVGAGRLSGRFGGDRSANGRARAAADPNFGPEEIDLADIDLEELGFTAYTVPRVKTARRGRSSHAQAPLVISAAASRVPGLGAASVATAFAPRGNSGQRCFGAGHDRRFLGGIPPIPRRQRSGPKCCHDCIQPCAHAPARQGSADARRGGDRSARAACCGFDVPAAEERSGEHFPE